MQSVNVMRIRTATCLHDLGGLLDDLRILDLEAMYSKVQSANVFIPGRDSHGTAESFLMGWSLVLHTPSLTPTPTSLANQILDYTASFEYLLL